MHAAAARSMNILGRRWQSAQPLAASLSARSANVLAFRDIPALQPKGARFCVAAFA